MHPKSASQLLLWGTLLRFTAAGLCERKLFLRDDFASHGALRVVPIMRT